MKRISNPLTWVMMLFSGCFWLNSVEAQTPVVDLSAYQGTPPAGATLEWHNAWPANTGTLMAPTQVQAATPGIYYAAYNYGGSPNCYSLPTGVKVLTNTCPATTVNLRESIDSTGKPANAVVTFHNLSIAPYTPSGSNCIANPIVTPGSVPIAYAAAYLDNSGCYSEATATIITVASECSGQLLVKVLLQGALFNSPTPGIMRDNLRAGNHIPLDDPYTGSGNPRFAHAGAGGPASTTSAVLSANAGTDNAIVDWVFVELRSPLDSAVVLETRVALLQRDGDVVSPTDGTSPLAIQGATGNRYFVAVKHRNHLGVMTATDLALSSAGTTVDFRIMNEADVYHRNVPFSYEGFEMVTVNGFKALWAGNANTDRKVKYQGSANDNATILAQVLGASGNTSSIFNYDLALGYFSGDINLDGKVKYQGTTNDPGFMFLNLITNFVLNALDLYNYDLFIEQLP